MGWFVHGTKSISSSIHSFSPNKRCDAMPPPQHPSSQNNRRRRSLLSGKGKKARDRRPRLLDERDDRRLLSFLFVRRKSALRHSELLSVSLLRYPKLSTALGCRVSSRLHDFATGAKITQPISGQDSGYCASSRGMLVLMSSQSGAIDFAHGTLRDINLNPLEKCFALRGRASRAGAGRQTGKKSVRPSGSRQLPVLHGHPS